MEGGESVLDNLFDDESVEDAQDVEMFGIEEGELIEQFSKAELGESSAVGVKQINQEPNQRKSRHKKKKKRNKKKKSSSSGPNITNINRFVLDVCKRFREKKSYLVWNAVGCLGISAFSDLVKEVDAIQACGGQKTADGKRFRNGGGILWNIIKIRDPNAYKEIMKKGKEFEKQFKQQRNGELEPMKRTNDSSQDVTLKADQITRNISDGLEHTPRGIEQSSGEQKCGSVHERIRLPVTYDDLLVGEDPKDEPA